MIEISKYSTYTSPDGTKSNNTHRTTNAENVSIYNINQQNTNNELEAVHGAEQGIEAPKTGGIYSELDRKTGITTTYNSKENTVTKTDRNGEIISITPMDPSKPSKTPATPLSIATTPEAEKTPETKIHMADFLPKQFSDETKEYLKNSQVFTEQSDEYVKLTEEKNRLNAELVNATKAKAKAKENFENTSYNDFETKAKAKELYFEAWEIAENLEKEILAIEEQKKKLGKSMIEYATTIQNWQDGTIVEYTDGIGGRREYTFITLPNGEKAYEYNGKHYPLAPNGIPQPEYIKKLHFR